MGILFEVAVYYFSVIGCDIVGVNCFGGVMQFLEVIK